MENQFGFFSLGDHTHKVPMDMHRDARQKLLAGLKDVSADRNAFVVVQGGNEQYRHDTDHEEVFRQESYFHYLFGVKEPGCFGVIDLNNKKSTLFVPHLDPSYGIWMGRLQPPAHFQQVYAVDECFYVNQLAEKLKESGCKEVLVLYGQNTDSGSYHVPAHFDGIDHFKVDKDTLLPILSECRVTKTPHELDLMRYVCRVSAEAHKEVMKTAKAGMLEYQLEALFCMHTYTHGGCRHQSYTCICGSGENSSILHYGHAGAPNSRQIKKGDIMMLDMGGEYHCYGADISRSWPIDGTFTESQTQIYETVLAAQEAVMSVMKAGVSWPDMHRLADRTICTHLKQHGFLKGDVDEMMKHFIGSLFMPHGLGHLLGIDTHDCGGYNKGCKRVDEPGLRKLRLGRVLEENMVVTVEPGVYFIRTLLEGAFNNPDQVQFLNVEKLTQFLDFGGVRIEDDVIVLKDGIENMSSGVPRTVKEIEALLASGK